MLLTLIFAAALFILARLVASRYIRISASNGIATAVVIAYALGLITYPTVFEASYLAAFPAATAQPIAAATTMPARPLPAINAKIVSCPTHVQISKRLTSGAIDYVSDGNGPAQPPAQGIDVSSGDTLKIGGWIVNASGPAKTVCAIVDGQIVLAKIAYGVRRDDVATALGKPNDTLSGYVVEVPLKLSSGDHTATIGAVQNDGVTLDQVAAPVIPLRVR